MTENPLSALFKIFSDPKCISSKFLKVQLLIKNTFVLDIEIKLFKFYYFKLEKLELFRLKFKTY